MTEQNLQDLMDMPIVVPTRRGALVMAPTGDYAELDLEQLNRQLAGERPIVCHRLLVAQKIRMPRQFPCLDVLELFAFARPAQNAIPTVRGLAAAMALPVPNDDIQTAQTLRRIVLRLLSELTLTGTQNEVGDLALSLQRTGWGWAKWIVTAIGLENIRSSPTGGYDIWRRLPEWQEQGAEGEPGDLPVGGQETRNRLKQLLGPDSEDRPAQAKYAEFASLAFVPREIEGAPNLVLAEAGTGTGKTLGYVAPASLWAERNGGPVWISTFTRNLQRQLDQELDRLYPDVLEKRRRVVVRKGRENYLCLLNFEEAVPGAGLDNRRSLALAMVARWAKASRDGDLQGGDFPGWLRHLLGNDVLRDLTDRRGECIHSACPHFRRCFIERNVRRSRRAELVVANHALTMIQAANQLDPIPPTRFVFDEGHHLFDAADSAFAAHLSGQEGQELRQWLRGNDKRAGRMQGLGRRAGDLVGGDQEAEEALQEIMANAVILPSEGWQNRLTDQRSEGVMEQFLALVRQQIFARQKSQSDQRFGLECGARPAGVELLEVAAKLEHKLEILERPISLLSRRLLNKLDEEADILDSTARARIDSLTRSLDRRVHSQIGPWRLMLRQLGEEKAPDEFVDWFELARDDGRDQDVGFRRHFLDPTKPFAHVVLRPAHGAIITSATLRDRVLVQSEDDPSWASAEWRTGALHMPTPARRIGLMSPYDHQNRTKVLIVGDVNRDAPDQVAAAYRELFKASGGGALGLFTSIGRLRQVADRITEPLADLGIDLLAQHVDAVDVGTLVDVFRAEEDSCLLGTDAVRDGVDVPGRSLRLIVFDRVPWPRPDILHQARKRAFGGSRYDDVIVRLRLKQAYGRLLRRADDRGIFVLLDGRTPTRLIDAFPENTVQRMGLAEAITQTRQFFDLT